MVESAVVDGGDFYTFYLDSAMSDKSHRDGVDDIKKNLK